MDLHTTALVFTNFSLSVVLSGADIHAIDLALNVRQKHIMADASVPGNGLYSILRPYSVLFWRLVLASNAAKYVFTFSRVSVFIVNLVHHIGRLVIIICAHVSISRDFSRFRLQPLLLFPTSAYNGYYRKPRPRTGSNFEVHRQRKRATSIFFSSRNSENVFLVYVVRISLCTVHLDRAVRVDKTIVRISFD